jgi:aspartyl-tRNA(Asn)/glutamyl-tRNA(Gln) amidotransferase subunit C
VSNKIDRDLVRHLERLARVDLAPDEVGMITEQLGRIVAFVEKLQAADVEGIDATQAMSLEASDLVREDVVTPSLDRAVVLKEAPDATSEFFRVPRVIDREDA